MACTHAQPSAMAFDSTALLTLWQSWGTGSPWGRQRSWRFGTQTHRCPACCSSGAGVAREGVSVEGPARHHASRLEAARQQPSACPHRWHKCSTQPVRRGPSSPGAADAAACYRVEAWVALLAGGGAAAGVGAGGAGLQARADRQDVKFSSKGGAGWLLCGRAEANPSTASRGSG